jgi:hypothetical protein
MEHQSKEKLTEALSELLVQIMEHPQCDTIVDEASTEAANNAGPESTHSGLMANLTFKASINVCLTCADDLSEQSSFYLDESRLSWSDHKPATCRKWSKEYEKGADAYRKAASDIKSVLEKLQKRLASSGI